MLGCKGLKVLGDMSRIEPLWNSISLQKTSKGVLINEILSKHSWLFYKLLSIPDSVREEFLVVDRIAILQLAFVSVWILKEIKGISF